MTSADGAIDCGAHCSTKAAAGTDVVLSAKPNADWTFEGWQGDCVGVAHSCEVSVDGPTVVRAVYERRPAQLSITVGGPGTIRSVPRGLACGGGARICTHMFGRGTTVQLRATPLHGGVFGGWQGPCSGNGRCAVAMSGRRSVTAAFGVRGASGTISAAPHRGRVVSVPAGLDCRNSLCSTTFAPGTLVVLHATVPFHDWIGACAGPVPTCPLVAGGQLPPAGARFPSDVEPTGGGPAPVGFTINVSVAGNGRVLGRSRGQRLACGRGGAVCSAVFARGVLVVLQAHAGGTSRFAGWSGGQCTGTGTCYLSTPLRAQFVVRATFRK